MITIPLTIVGDIWYNAQEFQDQVSNIEPDQYVLIDVNSEGPALGVFGIYEILAQSPTDAYIFTRWSNPIETGPYGKVMCSERSHFLNLSHHYWIDELKNTLAEKVFGLFIGRPSSARNYIMWDVHREWGTKFLLSKMSTNNNDMWDERVPGRVISCDPLKHWATTLSMEAEIKQWWATNPVSSIDSKSVSDQYLHPELAAAECVKSLLGHYNRFNFELVCETYTRGTTFFPTEKTIRAIMGNKPFLVYGPCDYLKNLQQLGFKTFSGIWNEQYDCLEGSHRWRTMKNIINMICNWDNQTRSAVLKQCESITRHNRNRLWEIIHDR